MPNYLYNGHSFPPAPEDWDRIKYPHAAIRYDSGIEGKYRFEVSAEKIRYKNTVVNGVQITAIIQIPSPSVCYEPDDTGDTWVFSHTRDIAASVGTNIAWTNHDIIKTSDGTVYCVASNPIDPETGEEIDYSPIPVTTPTIDPESLHLGYTFGQILSGLMRQ